MTVRLSTGLRNYVLNYGSVKNAIENGKTYWYSGSQPSSADAAPTGTLLNTFTAAAGTHTAEVVPYGSVELTGGASGSIDALTVNSVSIIDNAVDYDTDLATTATNLAAEINRTQSSPNYRAVIDSGNDQKVIIYAMRGVGSGANTYAVATTVTTITKTDTAFANGVDAVNGIKYDVAASGVITLASTPSVQGVASNDGVAGWMRIVGPVADSLAADTTASQIRIDLSIATSGADMNLANGTTVTSGATDTISSITITLPAS